MAKTCFFVSQIGSPDSTIRKRSDDIAKYVLAKALPRAYKIVRADQISDPGSINQQIIEFLYNSELVVADLTGSNANVFYEVGVRHAFNKPIVHLIDHKEKLPFDLIEERSIHFDLTDHRSTEKCIDDIKRQIRRLSSKGFKYRSPVFRHLVVAAEFDPKTASTIDDMYQSIMEIESEIGMIQFDISTSDVDTSSIEGDIHSLENEFKMVEGRLWEMERELKKINDFFLKK